MNLNIAPVPDLLRRFVPTPHVFSLCQADVYARIESNDLDIALEVRKLCMLQGKSGPQTVVLWKFIRDQMPSSNATGLTLLSDDPLRTLVLGSGTMITFDRRKGEMIGFVAPEVTAVQLVINLIPLLLSEGDRDRNDGSIRGGYVLSRDHLRAGSCRLTELGGREDMDRTVERLEPSMEEQP